MTNHKHRGFTLIEMAVVLLIIAVLLSAAILPLRGQKRVADITRAKKDLQAIEEALYGFAIANGRMPCPTLPGNGGNEVGGGAANCNSYHGFVPYNTLGIRGETNCDGLLTDPWGNPYRYSVTDEDNAVQGTVGVDDFVSNNEIAAVGAANLQPDIRVCGNLDNACNVGTLVADRVADGVVAVMFSMGMQWQNPSNSEQENAGEGGTVASGCTANYAIAGDRYFYAAGEREVGANRFDDIVGWISPNILYAKLLAAGQL